MRRRRERERLKRERILKLSEGKPVHLRLEEKMGGRG